MFTHQTTRRVQFTAIILAALVATLVLGAKVSLVYAQADDIPPNAAPAAGIDPPVNRVATPDQYDSLDDLPQDARAQFETTYEQYQKVKQELEEATPHKLAQARKRVEDSRKLEEQSNSLKEEYAQFEQSLQVKGDDTLQKFARWRQLFIESTQAGYYLDCREAPDYHAPLKPFAKTLITSLVNSSPASRPTGWGKIEPLLPANPNAITEEQALDVLMAWSDSVKTEAAGELQRLQEELLPPESVQQHISARYLANSAFTIFAPYLAQGEQGKVTDLKGQVSEVHQRLTDLWPTWERKLKEGPYAYLADLKVETPPAVVSAGRRFLLAINLLILIVLVFLFYFRKKSVLPNHIKLQPRK